LSAILSLTTSLHSLQLSSCHSITNQSFQRMGEGLGLVGIYCKQLNMNSMVCRIEQLPFQIHNRIHPQIHAVLKDSCYEYRCPIQKKNDYSIDILYKNLPSTSTDTTTTMNATTPTLQPYQTTICQKSAGMYNKCPPCTKSNQMNIILHTPSYRYKSSQMIFLHTISINRCSKITDNGIQILLMKSPYLTTLKLIGLPW
jgi:hypothetical protein